MEIRRFYAEDIEQAIEAAREPMGPDVIILDTVEVNDQAEVFASTETEEDEQEEAQQIKAQQKGAQQNFENHNPNDLAGLQLSLKQELADLRQYRQQLNEIDAKVDLLPEELQAELFLLRKS